MTTFLIILAITLSLALIWLQLKFAISQRVYVLNTLLGAAALAILNALHTPLGFYIGYNLISLCTCAVFGLPGIIFLAALRLL